MESFPERPANSFWHSLTGSAVLLLFLSATHLAIAELSPAEGDSPPTGLRPFIDRFCAGCHSSEKKKGKLDLEALSLERLDDSPKVWRKVVRKLRGGDMPPEDAPQPKIEQRNAIIALLEEHLPPEDVSSPGTAAHAERSMDALLREFCIRCHGEEARRGSLNLEALLGVDIPGHAETWEKVIKKLRVRQMPPAGEPRPSDASRDGLISRLSEALDAAAAASPQPGRTDTLRRLSRMEYRNAIRDLLALEIDADALLPPDEESHGFDNVTLGDLSPTLLDRYLKAAEKISRSALGGSVGQPIGEIVRIRPDRTQEGRVEGLPLGTRGGTLIQHHFPLDGEYEFRVRLTRDRNEEVEGLTEPHDLDVLLDGKPIASFTISPPKDGNHQTVDQHLKLGARIGAGPHRVGVTFPKVSSSLMETKRQPYTAHFNMHRHPRLTPAVFEVSITGPFEASGPGDTPSRRKILISYPKGPEENEACARRILSQLLRRAYRGPVAGADLERHLEFFRQGASGGGFDAGIERALTAILVSPRFLFRIEHDPPGAPPGTVYSISDLELASRLSFFLWSSLPDDALLDAAIAGELRDDRVLRSQVDRMLSDDRSHNLVINFAGQWLHLRNLESATPDQRLFPDFDDNLRQSFRQETELFVEEVFRQDRSILELLNADYTYLDERLARHYEIPHILGSRFRRVSLPEGDRRGGLLRQGSILTVTSYATRTSPVIRGHWILENLLGSPPPPPPPNVPALRENRIAADLTLRERLAQHRADPVCAGCHQQMDPVGFSLENYDAVGRWRDQEIPGIPVEAAGRLPGSEDFVGAGGLEENLLSNPEVFATAFTEKLLTFALGRGVEYTDAPAVRAILHKARASNYRFASIVHGIVQSAPFQLRTTR